MGQAAFIFIRLGLNVALRYQNRSYRDSETKENVEAQKGRQKRGTDRNRTATTKNKHNYKREGQAAMTSTVAYCGNY